MSAAPRGLSRPHASFIGTVCQGIHHCALHNNPPPARRPMATAAANTQRKTQQLVSNWNTRLSDHHTHQPHPTRGMADTKQTNEHTHPTTGARPGRTSPNGPMRLGSFTVRTPTTPPKKEAWPLLASTLQFSNHHHTTNPARHQPAPHETHGRGTTHPTRGRGDPGTQQHAPHHHRPHTGPRAFDLFHTSKDDPHPDRGGNASSRNRTPHGRPAKTP